jgi:hypothetical protein
MGKNVWPKGGLKKQGEVTEPRLDGKPISMKALLRAKFGNRFGPMLGVVGDFIDI